MKSIFAGNSLIFLLILCVGVLSACGQAKTKEQPEVRVGSDRDKHDCIASAGYTWSEVQQNCIRLFESGIRVEATDGKSSAFIVFSPDSTQAEVFFSNDSIREILDRRSLPAGGYAWNQEDDDTKNIRFIDGIWTISQRGKEIYSQNKSDADNKLGQMLIRTYEGMLPAADCPGIRYTLTIKNREYSGDGTFALTMTYLEAEDGKDVSFSSTGKRYTLKGVPGNDNATVWQLVPDDGDSNTNLLVDTDSTLTLLGADFKKPDSGLNYTIKLVK